MSQAAHFVLVPGAWLGSWAFDEVEARLSSEGHIVTSLTLSGLAEKADMPAAEIGLATHVADILEVLERENDPGRVVLVGHSYSGIPVGQAASRCEGELLKVVYLDSNVAHDGESFLHRSSEAGKAEVMGEIESNDGYWPPIAASELQDHDLTGDTIAQMVSRSTPHPGKTLTDPASLARPLHEIRSTYVKCLMDWPDPSDDVQELLESPRWDLVEMNTGHWPMFSRPEELAGVLSAIT